MKPIRPYKISVFNNAAQESLGSFYSNQIPRKGELVSFYGEWKRPETHPFQHWGTWRVDEVLWSVAHSASVTAFDLARETEGDMAAAYCERVDLLCWPAEGPHFVTSPRWAKAFRDPEEDEGL